MCTHKVQSPSCVNTKYKAVHRLHDLEAHQSSCDKKDNPIIVYLHEPDTTEVNIADKTATPEPVLHEPAVPRPVRRCGVQVEVRCHFLKS